MQQHRTKKLFLGLASPRPPLLSSDSGVGEGSDHGFPGGPYGRQPLPEVTLVFWFRGQSYGGVPWLHVGRMLRALRQASGGQSRRVVEYQEQRLSQ